MSLNLFAQIIILMVTQSSPIRISANNTWPQVHIVEANTSGATKCKAFDCTEYLYDDKCSSYNRKCLYNGLGCVEK